ncbi:hypothetical protein ABTA43_20100, partial [Acinetobacter baumannii]
FGVILSMRGGLFLLPVTNICKQFLLAKQKGDGVNTFTFPASVICQPEAGCDGLSAAIRSLGGIHLIQIAARLRRWMSGG